MQLHATCEPRNDELSEVILLRELQLIQKALFYNHFTHSAFMTKCNTLKEHDCASEHPSARDELGSPASAQFWGSLHLCDTPHCSPDSRQFLWAGTEIGNPELWLFIKCSESVASSPLITCRILFLGRGINNVDCVSPRTGSGEHCTKALQGCRFVKYEFFLLVDMWWTIKSKTRQSMEQLLICSRA